MKALKKIYYTFEVLTSATGNHPQACHYIRADIVEKLKGYVVHGLECRYWSWDPRTWKPEDCTCGLTEVLKELDAT